MFGIRATHQSIKLTFHVFRRLIPSTPGWHTNKTCPRKENPSRLRFPCGRIENNPSVQIKGSPRSGNLKERSCIIMYKLASLCLCFPQNEPRTYAKGAGCLPHSSADQLHLLHFVQQVHFLPSSSATHTQEESSFYNLNPG